MPSQRFASILFDLDGTLLDTAPDLLGITNQLLNQAGRQTVSLAEILPHISFGAKKLIAHAFQIDPKEKLAQELEKEFFTLYEQELCKETQLFPGIQELLQTLDERKIPWGIVTNKLTAHTLPLLKKLQINTTCVICGDTTAHGKPHPLPLITAAEILQVPVQESLFVGDSIIDIQTGKAAGSYTLAACYGYGAYQDDPHNWQADAYVYAAKDILPWIFAR